jgi:hypothetical protein
MLFIFRKTSTNDFPAFEISFGRDNRGVHTYVSISLEESDVPLMIAYLSRFGAEMAGSMYCDYPVDDDGGEELPVPLISVDGLTQLPMSSIVQ